MRVVQILDGSIDGYRDTQIFVESIASVLNPASDKHFFDQSTPIIVTRAPGRLDVMGGIADYSGSLVLQLPIAYATHVALQRTNSNTISIFSISPTARHIELSLNDFLTENRNPVTYAEARSHFSNESDHWASYIAGAFLILMRERGVGFHNGARIFIHSDVPEGKGVSSSAAVEVATMKAISVAFDIDLDAQEIGTLCQQVENLVAGAPSGIMDQMTSACAEENRLLELLCQPDILKGNLALPDELAVWGVDSGVRHSVSGSDYGTVRAAAFMGYRIIADVAGLQVTATDTADKVMIDDERWSGYLANISTEEFEERYSSALPETIEGAVFLERYSGTTDSLTNVDPTRTYPVRAATKHPIYENERVTKFASTLKNWRGLEQAGPLGELMFGSHQSYSDCGLGSEATDLIANLARSTEGLYGARITGGGSGGTVAVLGRADAVDGIERLKQDFYRQTGREPLVLSGSSAGAGVFKHLRLEIV